MSQNNKRYRTDKIHSKSLERNPIDTPADRSDEFNPNFSLPFILNFFNILL